MEERVHVVIRGAVQGVGFRPFLYRLATGMGIRGWVMNSPKGVFLEGEAEKTVLDAFLRRIEQERPPRAFIQSMEHSFLDPAGYATFEIRPSETDGEPTAIVLPDIATCPDCLAELFNPADRRYLYPFTNCTNCGPRFSIIESLPYDRAGTSMKRFAMCDRCRAEYDDPGNRRFHAQPNACPSCGPRLELWDDCARVLSRDHDALLGAARSLGEGLIIALKGLGGFQLLVDAGNESAVRRLRGRKQREEKPFALMVPNPGVAESLCHLSQAEVRLLGSPESPIVLLRRKDGASRVAASIAPGNPRLGLMLPYTPLHHILIRELGIPVVATSGNLSDEPLCTDEHEALERLHGIADLFLVHDRPIVRHVDDSVVRVMLGRELVLRRARGFAPLPVPVARHDGGTLLAVGAHLKNTVALSTGSETFVSQHIGDLETRQSLEAFRSTIRSFESLYRTTPVSVVTDMHPDYLSTQYARETGLPIISIQHHYAHVVSCMAENGIDGRVLGVSWDGTGYAPDGTVWGGEFLVTDAASFTRAGSLFPFHLPGPLQAIREPRRAALGVLYEVYGEEAFGRDDLPTLQAFGRKERDLLKQMLVAGTNSPVTTSAGRLFDAVSSLLGIRQRISFEGQAAMELEYLAHHASARECYGFAIVPSELEPVTSAGQPLLVADWRMSIRGLIDDLSEGVPGPAIAAKFHNTLVEMIVAIAGRVGEERVVLSGGCFQNAYLTERTVFRLRESGFHPYWHQRVPPNDGGISLGQVFAAVRLRQAHPGRKETQRNQEVKEV